MFPALLTPLPPRLDRRLKATTFGLIFSIFPSLRRLPMGQPLRRRIGDLLRISLLGRGVLLLLLAYSLLRRRRLVCLTARHGQMGNRLLLSAHVIATAIQNRMELINLSFDEYTTFFKGSSEDVWFRFPRRATPYLRRWPSLRRLNLYLLHAASQVIPVNRGTGLIQKYQLPEPEPIFDCGAATFQEALLRSRVLFLNGWSYRNHEQVALHAEVIRRHLEPRADIAAECRDLHRTLREGLDVLIGIHIRQGDYRTAWGGKLYYSTEQYAMWMRMLPALFPGQRVGFFIASNERQDPTLFDGLDCRLPPLAATHRRNETPIYDLVLLSGCDYLLGPPSSFSGWASFAGQVPLYFLRGEETALRLEDFAVYRLPG